MTAKELVQRRIDRLVEAQSHIQKAYTAELRALSAEAEAQAMHAGGGIPSSTFLKIHSTQLQELHDQHTRLEETRAALEQLLADVAFCEASTS